MEVKKCNKCKETKSIPEFDNYNANKLGSSLCKECRRAYRAEHLEEHRICNKRHYDKNKGKELERHRKWLSNNPAYFEAYKVRRRINDKARLKSDVHFLINRRVRISINDSLKYNRSKNRQRTIDILKSLGYSISILKQQLEKLFKPGMSWENYGKWHIDHIIPVSLWKFDSPNDREFKQCWSLCNLQPLWAEENIKKSNKCMG